MLVAVSWITASSSGNYMAEPHAGNVIARSKKDWKRQKGRTLFLPSFFINWLSLMYRISSFCSFMAYRFKKEARNGVLGMVENGFLFVWHFSSTTAAQKTDFNLGRWFDIAILTTVIFFTLRCVAEKKSEKISYHDKT